MHEWREAVKSCPPLKSGDIVRPLPPNESVTVCQGENMLFVRLLCASSYGDGVGCVGTVIRKGARNGYITFLRGAKPGQEIRAIQLVAVREKSAVAKVIE
jgi:predicted RNA-binding protein with TRAM domain